MSKISIERHHTLSQEQCNKLTLSIAEQWQKKLGGKIESDGNAVRYNHLASRTSGVVESSDNTLKIKVNLGFMMNFMKPKIEQEINRMCDEHLGKQE